MQIAGKSHRVRLIKSLAEYAGKFQVGELGKTVPNISFSSYGDSDDFVAVMFDNGIEIDVLFNDLEFLD